MFPWAPFRSAKAAVKLHALLDLRGNIPSFIFISDGKTHGVNILDELLPEAGAFYVMGRGYLDFERLARLVKHYKPSASAHWMHCVLLKTAVELFRAASRDVPKSLASGSPHAHRRALPTESGIVPTASSQQGDNTMNRYMMMALSMLAGAALGGAAIQTLHAQAKPHAYVIAEITNIRDQDKYLNEFAPAVTKAQEAMGGKYLVRGGKTESYLGSPPAPRVVVIEYDSLDKVQAWWNSQATKDAFAIGKKYADFRQFAVEGLAP